MARRSSIKTLPPKALQKLNKLLEEGKVTLDEIEEWLDGIGHPRSRSAIHRHKQHLDKALAATQKIREVSRAFAEEAGEDLMSSKQGEVLLQLFRAGLYDTLENMANGKSMDPRDAMFLGKALKDAVHALRLTQDYKAKVLAELAAKAAKAAREVVGEKGLSDEVAKSIENKILGIGS